VTIGTVETDNAPSEGNDLRIKRREFKGHGGGGGWWMGWKEDDWTKDLGTKRYLGNEPAGCTEKECRVSLDPKPGRLDNVTLRQ
jgi:hypothetical protein